MLRFRLKTEDPMIVWPGSAVQRRTNSDNDDDCVMSMTCPVWALFVNKSYQLLISTRQTIVTNMTITCYTVNICPQIIISTSAMLQAAVNWTIVQTNKRKHTINTIDKYSIVLLKYTFVHCSSLKTLSAKISWANNVEKWQNFIHWVLIMLIWTVHTYVDVDVWHAWHAIQQYECV